MEMEGDGRFVPENFGCFQELVCHLDYFSTDPGTGEKRNALIWK